jgi:hypothetical protein
MQCYTVLIIVMRLPLDTLFLINAGVSRLSPTGHTHAAQTAHELYITCVFLCPPAHLPAQALCTRSYVGCFG